MSIYEELAKGIKIVEAWPEVEPVEVYELRLTKIQWIQVWTLAWRRWGVRSLPVLVNEDLCEHTLGH